MSLGSEANVQAHEKRWALFRRKSKDISRLRDVFMGV